MMSCVWYYKTPLTSRDTYILNANVQSIIFFSQFVSITGRKGKNLLWTATALIKKIKKLKNDVVISGNYDSVPIAALG